MKINKTTFGKPCFRALYGSQNYRLNSENSDKDYMALIKPEWKDFIDGRISRFKQRKNAFGGYDTSIDFRRWFVDLRKGNFNALELLWSVDKHAMNGYDFVFNEMVGNRDLIAKSARSGTFKAIRGMCHKLSSNLYPTPKEMSYQMMFGEWLKILANGGEYKDFFDIAPSTFERIKEVKNGLVKPTDKELNGWRKIEEKIPENFPFNLEELLMSYEESILFE